MKINLILILGIIFTVLISVVQIQAEDNHYIAYNKEVLQAEQVPQGDQGLQDEQVPQDDQELQDEQGPQDDQAPQDDQELQDEQGPQDDQAPQDEDGQQGGLDQTQL